MSLTVYADVDKEGFCHFQIVKGNRMAKKTITINEALNWQKVLNARIAELTNLRNQNSARETRLFGNQDEKRISEPMYDVAKLDRTLVGLHRETRLLNDALKNTNQVTHLIGYEADDDILGEVSVMDAQIQKPAAAAKKAKAKK